MSEKTARDQGEGMQGEGTQTPQREPPYHQRTEDYGGGHIQARHGRVNGWLLLVYLVMFLWALYYGYRYWGGLGPGLDLGL